MWAVLCLAITLTAVSSHPWYQLEIPNGASVPSPCGSGTWDGVGHMHIQGAGPLNPFGMDFQAAGHTWTVALCQKDSDGDGQTNGEELGDPNCIWVSNSTDSSMLQPATGHPGFHTPAPSSVCHGPVVG